MRDTRVQRRSNIHAQFRRGKWEFGAEERKERDISATMSATQRARSPVVGEPEAGKSAEPVASHRVFVQRSARRASAAARGMSDERNQAQAVMSTMSTLICRSSSRCAHGPAQPTHVRALSAPHESTLAVRRCLGDVNDADIPSCPSFYIIFQVAPARRAPRAQPAASLDACLHARSQAVGALLSSTTSCPRCVFDQREGLGGRPALALYTATHLLLEELERRSVRAVNGRRCSPPAAYLAPRTAWAGDSVVCVCRERRGSCELSRRSDMARRVCALLVQKSHVRAYGVDMCRCPIQK